MILKHLGNGQIEDWDNEYAQHLLAIGMGERVGVQESAPFTEREQTPTVNTAEEESLAAALLAEASKRKIVEAAAMAPAPQKAVMPNVPRFSRGPRAPQNPQR